MFEKVENSSFCKGNNDRGWVADFDWILKNDDIVIKILEGKYDEKEQQPKPNTKYVDDNPFNNKDAYKKQWEEFEKQRYREDDE